MEIEGAQPFPLPSPPIGLPSILHRILSHHRQMVAPFFFGGRKAMGSGGDGVERRWSGAGHGVQIALGVRQPLRGEIEILLVEFYAHVRPVQSGGYHAGGA